MTKSSENYNGAVKGFIAAILLFMLTACAWWCGLSVGCAGAR
jgi:hypothetical protein